MVEDNRRGTGKSTQSWATDGDESIDIAELDETIRNFSQDLLQMAASKNNFDRFKIVSGQLTSRISFCLSSSIESTIAQSQIINSTLFPLALLDCILLRQETN